jgi:excisionase family DNA binding protein
LLGEYVNTYDIDEAARIAHVHPNTMRKMAAAKRVPAAKIGRSWVFPVHLFDTWIENKCLSTDAVVRPTGGAKYPSLAMRLASRRKQPSERKPKSSSTESGNVSGGSTS